MNIFERMWSIEEGNKKLYSLFTHQYGPCLNNKLKGTKGCDKVHNAQDGVKLLGIVRSVVCGTELHIQGT